MTSLGRKTAAEVMQMTEVAEMYAVAEAEMHTREEKVSV
jgi:hypothetical protein